ncbi:hypothetical protein GALMADRAFT_855174 [Galerina marginata CBS 339.88]|uniref:F-box domain-containing protein n=1 Tax=Galerina marginata (strain CBS 339.88) TaxID=685588 RepID=A0A067TV47_GALM3|nr:hypothetical protein GALMADRAFT_855174 [Galerina marginata CBS 339.88]
MKQNLHFNELPMDIVLEILGQLPMEDILRVRQVCRRLCQASYQRSVWVSAYERSRLLLPEGPLSSQSSFQLEALMIRATKIERNWTSPRPAVFTQRRFPLELPTYDFGANIISGRFLQLVRNNGISWYDLDSSDIGTAVLTYSCPTVLPMYEHLHYQVNANGEGPDSVWVAFLSRSHFPPKIIILKVDLSAKKGYKVECHEEIPGGNITKIKIGFDWLLPVKEFTSPDEPMELFHIPSRSVVYLPMHHRAQHLSDLNCMNYAIAPGFLVLTFVLKNETLFDTYTLPRQLEPYSSGRLIRSHSGVYPHGISNIQVVESATPLERHQSIH